MINVHPILSAIVVDEDSNSPYFARLPFINLEDVVTFKTRFIPTFEPTRDIELDQILENDHNRGFKERYGELPFWRLIVTTTPGVENEFTASFIFHHALGDGTSGMAFHKSFLAGLLNPITVENTIIVLPLLPLLPTLEGMLPSATIPKAPRHIPTELWTGNKIASTTHTHYLSHALSQDTSMKFLKACKVNGTTLTATLSAIIAVSLVKSLPSSTKFSELECTIPISLRRFLPAPIDENELGVWIDAFSTYYRRSDILQFSWEEARKCRMAITDVLAKEGQEVNVFGLRNVTDMREYFLAKIGQERTSSFNVSNVGCMKLSADGGDWKMGRMIFSRSAFVAGSAIDVGVITGPDGCIVLGFCRQEGIVSEELVKAVIRRVKTEIYSAAALV